MKLKKLLSNREGLIIAGIIAITFIVSSSIVWLCCALFVNKVFDAFIPIFAVSDERALQVSQNGVNAFGVSIVIVDILLLVWWGLSAQKTGSREEPIPL